MIVLFDALLQAIFQLLHSSHKPLQIYFWRTCPTRSLAVHIQLWNFVSVIRVWFSSEDTCFWRMHNNTCTRPNWRIAHVDFIYSWCVGSQKITRKSQILIWNPFWAVVTPHLCRLIIHNLCNMASLIWLRSVRSMEIFSLWAAEWWWRRILGTTKNTRLQYKGC